MGSTKQETPIYGMLIIHMDLSKATVNIPFCTHVWCGDQYIGPYFFFSQRQPGDIYANVLRHELPALSENVPLQTRHHIYYRRTKHPLFSVGSPGIV